MCRRRIVSGPLIAPAPFYTGHYFPMLGHRPGYGRREIEPPPNRPLPRPAPTYYREWSAQSDMTAPATLNAPDSSDIEVRRRSCGWNRDHRRLRERHERCAITASTTVITATRTATSATTTAPRKATTAPKKKDR